MSDSITIDGVGPMTVERPATVAELCAIVRRCADTKTAIYPVGGGTMLDFGIPPARPGIALSTTALNQVIDYPARDLTITVQAGITMKELQATLAKENQWLPIDIPETATIGGAIACDVSGPRRYGYGTLRDYVIGITVVNDRGEETHAGGRVVKNVAGYDFMKLHTGALGTLGVITQVTLKVKPKPEAWGMVTAPFVTGERLTAVINAIAATTIRPVSIIAHQHNGRGVGWSDGPVESRWIWSVVLGFEGSCGAVRWNEERARQELAQAAADVCVLPPEAATWDYAGATIPQQLLCARVVPTRVAEFALFSAGLSDSIGITACAGTGFVELTPYNAESRPEWDFATAERVFRQLLDKAAESNGNVVVQHGPHEWKKQFNIWGHPPADLALQKAVKRALDPQNLFNPGRFVADAF
jgi:glycolate oxidase FAD binding subunit